MRKIMLAAALLMAFISAAQAETIKASVNGMVCAFCATGIEKTFKAQPAVNTVKVDLENKLVTITTRSNQTMSNATITRLITNAGYSVTGIKRDKR